MERGKAYVYHLELFDLFTWYEYIFFSFLFLYLPLTDLKGTPSIRVSNYTRSENSTSWKLAAIRAMQETRSTILGTAPT